MHRVDLTAKDLIQQAKDLGALYAAADGTWDGVLWMPSTGQLELVDWKSPPSVHKQAKRTSGRTARQEKLRDAGWPLRFVVDEDALRRLLRCG